jgi:DNA repair exonuclease SbcCD ATPase subunit
MKRILIGAAICAVIAAAAAVFLVQQRTASRVKAELTNLQNQLADLKAKGASQAELLAQAQRERDAYKEDAAEVHKLRGESTALRAENKELERKAAAAAEALAKSTRVLAPASRPRQPIPNSFANYAEMAAFTATLRAKAFRGGTLTPEEREWLQKQKPELEKLEHSPADFAAFQASLIQSAIGITDPQKVEQIQRTIEKVYENAVSRGLDIPSRRVDDPTWTDQRHQLDRRGTQAVDKLLTADEKAAFNQSFLGIMGIDLGTGVDQSLYPPGFVQDSARRQ